MLLFKKRECLEASEDPLTAAVLALEGSAPDLWLGEAFFGSLFEDRTSNFAP